MPNNTTDDNPQNDATYGTITYLGGDACSTYDNNCMTFNARTGKITTVGVAANFANPSTNTVKVCAQVQGDINHATEPSNLLVITQLPFRIPFFFPSSPCLINHLGLFVDKFFIF